MHPSVRRIPAPGNTLGSPKHMAGETVTVTKGFLVIQIYMCGAQSSQQVYKGFIFIVQVTKNLFSQIITFLVVAPLFP